MTRNEMVTQVNSLYDQITELETQKEISELKSQYNVSEETVRIVNKNLSPEERMLLEIGKKAFFERIYYSWRTVTAKRGEDNKIVLGSFEGFCKEAIQSDKLPMDLSLNAAITLVEDLLKRKYMEKAQEATKKLIAKEKEEEAKAAEESNEEED